jgi:hypothetical protein
MGQLLLPLFPRDSRMITLTLGVRVSPYPPNMKNQEGANELTKKALKEGIKPNEILENALIRNGNSWK